jgi:hypothetical protein
MVLWRYHGSLKSDDCVLLTVISIICRENYKTALQLRKTLNKAKTGGGMISCGTSIVTEAEAKIYYNFIIEVDEMRAYSYSFNLWRGVRGLKRCMKISNFKRNNLKIEFLKNNP